jgi:hypothetical protein
MRVLELEPAVVTRLPLAEMGMEVYAVEIIPELGQLPESA